MGDHKSRRCSTCDINYPTHVLRCLLCADNTWGRYTVEPDDDWSVQVREKTKPEPPVPLPELPDPYLKDAEAKVFDYADNRWVAHGDLISAGYAHLESFSIVRIDGLYYELQAHVGKTARNFVGGAWWLLEVDPEVEVARLFVHEGWSVLPDHPKGG